MKIKGINFFLWHVLLIVVGMSLEACSQVDDTMESVEDAEQIQADENGMYHYKMHLDCIMPSYDDNGQTRAMTYDWNNNSRLFIRFKNGSSWITGQATYDAYEKVWNVTASNLFTITGEETCEVYYFGTTSSTVTMNEKAVCYLTKTATYTRPSSSYISIKASLDKMTWRMRFKGTYGTSITLPSDDNDIYYFTNFNQTTGDFTKSKKDVTLTVSSDGYTPYIYGEFKNSGNNTITVSNNDGNFTKEIAASKLKVGESAYMVIPTAGSHSGWTSISNVDQKATIEPDYLVTFTDGIVTDWNVAYSVETFGYTVLTKSAAAAITDDDIAKNIAYNYTWNEAANNNFFKGGLEPNTEYCLCVVAKNSSGVRGPVSRYQFKTNSESLPYADISNCTVNTSYTKWSFDISLKNNANSFYAAVYSGESYNNNNWHFIAYSTHEKISSGQLGKNYSAGTYSVTFTTAVRYLTVCTWACGTNNAIGNATVKSYSVSNAVGKKNLSPLSQSFIEQMISKEEMQKVSNNIEIYRLER